MRKLFAYLSLALVAVSCGPSSGYFRLEGRFRNFNQGEFYLYSLEGSRGRMDTIKVADGRFSLEKPIAEPTTYALVFPNFSEIPVFAESGATVDMQGDASHLKEVRLAGTKENELMTEFRLKAAQQTPPEVVKAAEKFVKEHPATASSRYLTDKYFLQRPDPDYKKAAELVTVMAKAQPDNLELQQLRKSLKGLRVLKVGQRLPDFKAVDVRGRKVSNESLSGDINVLAVWATWNYESTNLQRQLRQLKKDYGAKLGLVGICLDACQRDCRSMMDRDSITWPTVCDGRMFDSPPLAQLGIADVPVNIVIDGKGKIIALNINPTELKLKVKNALK